MKATIYTTAPHEANVLTVAADTMRHLFCTGPIAAMSLRVESDWSTSLVIHLESGEDVSVPRKRGETWAQAIERFNAAQTAGDVNP